MSTTTTEMRLACVHCDDDSADGVTEIPPGWEDVAAVDTSKQEDSEWWTHLGTCPTCARGGCEVCRQSDAEDAKRFRKLMDLATYGGTYKGEHVWRFKPIMGPHQNLLDAVDNMGK